MSKDWFNIFALAVGALLPIVLVIAVFNLYRWPWMPDYPVVVTVFGRRARLTFAEAMTN
jgi:hypothetical protein